MNWPRTGVLIIAAGLSVATAPPPSWNVSGQAPLDIELSEQAPAVSLAVSATFDVPDDETELVLSVTARVRRAIGAGETMTVTIDADDGLDGTASDSRDLARELTVLTARADLDYCGRPCSRDFVVTLAWSGAPANDVTSVELEINASATGGDTTEVPPGAEVAVTAELIE